jgi:hypothetical protein
VKYGRQSPWPTSQEEWLLRAALLRGPAAAAAWTRWKSLVDFDNIDSESYRLVPLLYCNLRDHGVSDPLLGRLRGIYRRTWYQNQLHMHAMASPLRALHVAGIPIMLLKGAALLLQYYRDYGMRPMQDFDVCVPEERATEAVEVLRAQGFTVHDVPEDVFFGPVEHPVRLPELELVDSTGHVLDLHWRLFSESIARDVTPECWQAATELEALGTPTRALCPADQVLYVCVHGLVRGAAGWETARVRWVMDLVSILRISGDAIEWRRLLRQAQRGGFIPPLREALTYLRRTLDAPVPDDVLQELRTMPVPMVDRVVHAARMQPPEHWGPWLTVCVGYVEHRLSLPPGAGTLRALATLPGYYRRRWRARTVWSVPAALVFRAARRVGWTMRRRGNPWPAQRDLK